MGSCWGVPLMAKPCTFSAYVVGPMARWLRDTGLGRYLSISSVMMFIHVLTIPCLFPCNQVQKVRASSIKSAFTKDALHRSAQQQREMAQKWRLEEEERQRQWGDDARDSRRGVDQVMDDMNACLVSIVSSFVFVIHHSIIPPAWTHKKGGAKPCAFGFVALHSTLNEHSGTKLCTFQSHVFQKLRRSELSKRSVPKFESRVPKFESLDPKFESQSSSRWVGLVRFF